MSYCDPGRLKVYGTKDGRNKGRGAGRNLNQEHVLEEMTKDDDQRKRSKNMERKGEITRRRKTIL